MSPPLARDQRSCEARVAYVAINGTGLGLCWGTWFGPMEPGALQKLPAASGLAVRSLAMLRSSILGTTLAFASVFACYQGVLCGLEPFMRQWQAGALAGGVVGVGVGLSALPLAPTKPLSRLNFLQCVGSYAVPFSVVSACIQLFPPATNARAR